MPSVARDQQDKPSRPWEPVLIIVSGIVVVGGLWWIFHALTTIISAPFAK
jgi:hypothetical protein